MDILDLFFEYPTRYFQIRGIAKILKIPKTTVGYHINDLIKKRLILKNDKGVFPRFIANATSELYLFQKKQAFQRRLLESGLLDYLEEECDPRSIILFGSFAKGEYDHNSDIDLFVQSKDTSLELAKYEKKLKHKVNILFEVDIFKLSPELLNNIINGIKLRGYIKVK